MTDELQIPELDEIVAYSELRLLLDNVCNMFDSYIRMSSRKGNQYQLRAFTDWNSPQKPVRKAKLIPEIAEILNIATDIQPVSAS